jgi:hypothetical protein
MNMSLEPLRCIAPLLAALWFMPAAAGAPDLGRGLTLEQFNGVTDYLSRLDPAATRRSPTR